MKTWLFKSEPGAYSWDDLVRDGRTGWDGVRNHQANNNMKAMTVGDLGFFYHSVKEKRIVGVVEVAGPHTLDPSDPTGRFGMVTVIPVEAAPKPVGLETIKADPALAGMALVRQSRLSVLPVSAAEWKRLCTMAGLAHLAGGRKSRR